MQHLSFYILSSIEHFLKVYVIYLVLYCKQLQNSLHFLLLQNGTLHPKVAKENLALELVTRFYNEELATLAKAEFDNVFKSNQLPSDMNEVEVEEGIWICKALVDAGIEPSTSQARRDIKQGAVRVDQEKISDEKLNLDSGEYILQVGKRKFAKVKVG